MKKQVKSIGRAFKFNGIRYPRLDAKEDLIFEMKKIDINSSKKGDPNQCPMACTIKRVFGDAYISRDIAIILQAVHGVIYAVRYRLPAKAAKAVSKFDASGLFPIGEYRLKAITPSQTLEAKRSRNKKKTTGAKRKVRPHIKFQVRRMQPAKFA